MVDALLLAMCKDREHMHDASIVETLRHEPNVKKVYLTNVKFKGRRFCIAVELKADSNEVVEQLVAKILGDRSKIEEVVPIILRPHIRENPPIDA
ncbi:MAG: hypothetical protein ACRD5H_17430 [Nitrososphaerales archaeon]